MTVQVNSEGAIELSGRCGADDAEALQRHLLAIPGATVVWSRCEHLHGAVAQVLLVAAPPLSGTPRNSFLKTHIAPILNKKRTT